MNDETQGMSVSFNSSLVPFRVIYFSSRSDNLVSVVRNTRPSDQQEMWRGTQRAT